MSHKSKDTQCVVIGANGLVGRRVGEVLTKKGIEWIGTCNKRLGKGLLKLDITDQAEVKRFFSEFSPDAIFNCANLAGGVDFCEANPKKAADFHLNATKEIGNYCNAINAMTVFISTDYVFDGTRGPYGEEDKTNPLNLYGSLKLHAEEWLKKKLKRYLVIRTTNVYGWDPETVTPNYIMGVYRRLNDKKPVNAPSFLWGNPTYVGDLAEAIVELYLKKTTGIFHVVGNSFVNRFEWAKKTSEILGLDESLINEVKKPSPNMIPRPLKSCLSTHKFKKSCKTFLHNLSDGLELMKSDMENKNAKAGIYSNHRNV